FSELPGDRHGVSANASKTKPAKLLAVFVVDTNETELTILFGKLRFKTFRAERLRREKMRDAKCTWRRGGRPIHMPAIGRPGERRCGDDRRQSQRLAFVGKPGRCTRTIQKR